MSSSFLRARLGLYRLKNGVMVGWNIVNFKMYLFLGALQGWYILMMHSRQKQTFYLILVTRLKPLFEFEMHSSWEDLIQFGHHVTFKK